MFENIKQKAMLAVPVAGVSSLALPVAAFAADGETTSMATINNAVTTAMSGIKDDAINLVSAVLPYALGVMAIGVVVSIGIRIFRRFAH